MKCGTAVKNACTTAKTKNICLQLVNVVKTLLKRQNKLIVSFSFNTVAHRLDCRESNLVLKGYTLVDYNHGC